MTYIAVFIRILVVELSALWNRIDVGITRRLKRVAHKVERAALRQLQQTDPVRYDRDAPLDVNPQRPGWFFRLRLTVALFIHKQAFELSWNIGRRLLRIAPYIPIDPVPVVDSHETDTEPLFDIRQDR